MKTIVYLAHPQIDASQSQQFLIQAGTSASQVTYVDLQQQFQQDGGFDLQVERQRLLEYQRIIFQFHLYWYQAPAILKIWLDQVFDLQGDYRAFKQALQAKELGLVVIAGVKASHYQFGGREDICLSALLSPYRALAGHFHMTYLPPLTIHQFAYLSTEEQYALFWDYILYLQTGKIDDFSAKSQLIIQRLEQLQENQLDLPALEQAVFESFVDECGQQDEALADYHRLMEGW
ncbi:NAD(P)H-dependent oxidoreductase [Vaginisenegalia massiliensis]|uniref:NAD(P)H-dependent oxidoreductase n=1 Tax=Vaginisenegalia massiliensis TaxID=2058294 RepID=UPI000F54C0B6|nr:NAD(P)H-dependent oxidoreductase [Vaginisenegalia massiliensis]